MTETQEQERADTTGSAIRSDRLRVHIITEDDPLYVIQFFDEFFPNFPRDEIEIVGVTVQAAFHDPMLKTALRMWRFYGPVDFVRLACGFAVSKLKRRSIAGLAAAHDLPLLPWSGSVNDAEFIAEVRKRKPDVLVSVAAPEIFHRELLDVPRVRSVNIHSGRLPKYRGMMPNFWQLLHGETNATVTVHEMAEDLDAGAVISTLEVPIHQKDSLHRVIVETKRRGAHLMIDVLRALRAGTDTPVPLDMSEKGYFSFPKPKDVRALRRAGHRML